LLAALDRMAGAVEGALYSTAAVLTIDIESLEVRYAVAGHPPALVRAHDGRVRRLDGGRSAPLGLSIEERPEATTRLAAGDLVVLYTDGLIERRGEGVDAGLDRLSDALAASDPDSDAWCDDLIERSLRGSVQADDVAVLGVQLTLQLDEIAGSAAALTLR
jgi:serine phosphatase RsbU (regulator of sigma subunit)